MWSTGCIVLELHEGSLTFDTHDTPQHLAMMERLSGAYESSIALLRLYEGSMKAL
jgi:CDC-like kinase